MKPLNQILFWVVCSILLLLFVWTFNDVLLPFVLGTVIAYLLNPLILLLGKAGVTRLPATLLILLVTSAVVITLITLLAPLIYQEVIQLANSLPGYIDTLQQKLNPYLESIQENLATEDINQNITEAVQNNVGNALTAGVNIFEGLMTGGQAVFGFFYVLIVTPLVAFFMMKEWESITSWIDGVLPRHNYQEVKSLLSKIDSALAGFIRGQLLVALILGTLYAIALTIAGLQFGFLIGLMAGVLSIIPLVGSTVGLLVGVFVAWFQNGEWSYVAIIAAIFMVGQFLEGNFITPKLVGDSVGLHPLWVLFAITAGGAMFGVLGILIAVPIAAVVGVLGSFTLKKYRNSAYYSNKNNKNAIERDQK